MTAEPRFDNLSEYVIGYPKLAAYMSMRPETTLFRNFSTLNTRNLLYMQAELANLENRLDKITREDDASKTSNKKRYATHFGYLACSYDDADQEQLELILKIRLRLHKYNQALLEIAAMNKMESPDQFDLHDLQDYLGCSQMGPLALEGEDAFLWGSVADPTDFKADIVTLKQREKADALSRWVAERATIIIRCFGSVHKPSTDGDGVVVYDSSILRVTFWITSIIASMLPVASIVVLSHLKSQAAKLGAIAAFNALINLCLNVLTDATRIDCFAVTAAFTAVQVVFISVGEASVK